MKIQLYIEKIRVLEELNNEVYFEVPNGFYHEGLVTDPLLIGTDPRAKLISLTDQINSEKEPKKTKGYLT